MKANKYNRLLNMISISWSILVVLEPHTASQRLISYMDGVMAVTVSEDMTKEQEDELMFLWKIALNID